MTLVFFPWWLSILVSFFSTALLQNSAFYVKQHKKMRKYKIIYHPLSKDHDIQQFSNFQECRYISFMIKKNQTIVAFVLEIVSLTYFGAAPCHVPQNLCIKTSFLFAVVELLTLRQWSPLFRGKNQLTQCCYFYPASWGLHR